MEVHPRVAVDMALVPLVALKKGRSMLWNLRAVQFSMRWRGVRGGRRNSGLHARFDWA
jgi:hypothetical protein